MKVINLRDIYPHYTQDCFIEVTDEVRRLSMTLPILPEPTAVISIRAVM